MKMKELSVFCTKKNSKSIFVLFYVRKWKNRKMLLKGVKRVK